MWPARLLLHRRRPGRRRHGRRRCGRPSTACATAVPTRTRPGGTTGRCSASTGCRSSTSSTATSRCPTPTAATGSSSTARSTTTSSCARSWPRPGATFATEGDTEAIVAGYHLWGEDVVPRLRGMFAFVIWDTQTRTVFGARDPFGIKPLFTTRLADGGIVFSSEKKALLELLGGSKAAGGVDARLPAALPDAAVRPGAGDAAPGHPPDRERHELHGRGRRAAHQALLPPDLPDPAGREGRGAGALRPDRRRPRRLGADAHAGRRHGRLVPLRRHRLHRHRRPGQALQPEPADLHDRLRARGLLRDRRRRRVRRGDRRRAHHQGGDRRGVRRRDPAGRLVPRRPGRRPGARAAVLHRPRGPQAREGRALRRGRRRAVRRLQHLPRAALAGGVRQAADAASAGRWARCRRRLPDGMRGKDLLRRGSIPLEQRYYGNARIFRDDELGFLRAPRPGPVARGGHRRALRADPRGRLRRRHRDAVRRPVHLAARRHPGQGRQDDDGQLARAAGAVPRPRGLQGRRARCRSTSG